MYAPPCIPGTDVGERRFTIGIFPKGLVLSQDCLNPLKYSLVVQCLWKKKPCEFHKNPYLLVTLCMHDREIWGISRGIIM